MAASEDEAIFAGGPPSSPPAKNLFFVAVLLRPRQRKLIGIVFSGIKNPPTPPTETAPLHLSLSLSARNLSRSRVRHRTPPPLLPPRRSTSLFQRRPPTLHAVLVLSSLRTARSATLSICVALLLSSLRPRPFLSLSPPLPAAMVMAIGGGWWRI